MKRPVRLGLLAALLGAGMLMAGASPAAAGVPDVELKLAKEKSGPYSDTLRRNVGSNEKKNVFLRAKNKNDEMDSVNLFSPDSVGDYTFKYFRSNGESVTSEVASGGGLLFDLGPGRAKVFRVRIKAGPNPDPDCIAPNVIFSGGGDDSAGLGINIDPAAC